MSEADIVRNCAPTLAGLKTGSIFSCPMESREGLLGALRQMNEKLGPKGLRMLPLRFSGKRALIYLYRPGKLRRDLCHSTARALLEERGYDPANSTGCVGCLMKKLRQEPEFPHEIGLFLGYPPEDVLGFIRQGPSGCKCTGCWRVYGDEQAAKQTFARYKACTRVYCRRHARGADIEGLTVAE